MSSEASTLLGRLAKARAECIHLAEDAKRLLAENGRPIVSVVRADKLRFALMGQYNAGKSTLVNALLGKAVAPTGDVPTTRQAQPYEFRDFHILDLPGSDARAAEQQVAERALHEVHLVLYVVSSETGLDYKSFWNDLRNLIASGQHWLVAVNDKQPHPDETSARGFREKLLASFRQRADEMVQLTNWDGRLFWVNADSALRARRADLPKRRLEEASGIVPLENQLVELLSENDDFLKNVPSLTDLLHALADAAKAWGDRLESDESRRLNAGLQRCDTAKEKLTVAADEIAHKHFALLREALAALLTRRLGDSNSQDIAAEADGLIHDTRRSAAEAFEGRCQAEFQILAAHLGGASTSEKFVGDDNLNLNLGSLPHISRTEGFDWGSLLNRLVTSAPAITQLVQGLTTEAAPALVQEGAKALAKAGGEQVAETAVKQGGRQVLGKVLGPAVIILVAGWEIYSGWHKAKKEEQQMLAAVRERVNIAARTAANSHEKFIALASCGVSSAMEPFIKQLTEKLNARGQDVSALEGRLARAGELRSRLQRVIAELNARSQE